MKIKNRITDEVIHSGEFGTMEELLLDAIGRGADLRSAYLRSANLRSADLSGAYLSGANLGNANLSGANLRSADLRDCAGNRSQIKSLFISDIYPITYTYEYLQIGCERHSISEWWDFGNEIIAGMGGKKALKFWGANKDFIKLSIESYPAIESVCVDK